MKCPRCKKNELNPKQVRNALSRRDNKTYICSPCGTSEAMFDFARSRSRTPEDIIINERAWLKEVQ